MKLAIMQPYIFPYIGYFQLIKAVDTFVIYDDVNFIKQGWINRNRILLDGKDFMFNIILKGASSFRKINEINIVADNHKLNRTIEQAYRKAPYFNEVYPMIVNILSYNETNLAKYLINSICVTLDYLGINISILVSSEIEKNTFLKGGDKVVDICKQLKATNYVNANGGQKLYSKELFAENGLTLNFIKTKPIIYSQYKNEFIPCLSIIDVMMFNSKEKISELIEDYSLV